MRAVAVAMRGLQPRIIIWLLSATLFVALQLYLLPKATK
jgi:hypothetical protein